MSNKNLIKKVIAIFLPIFIFILLYSQKRPIFISDAFFEMGTLIQITLPEKNNSLIEQSKKMMKNLTDTVSNDTLAISGNSQTHMISEFTYRLLLLAEIYSTKQPGFSPATSTISSLYGFPSGPYKMPDTQQLAEAFDMLKNYKITCYNENGTYYANAHGLKVDLGAYAKGAIVDEISRMFIMNGVTDFIVNAGGDMRSGGTKAGKRWTVGITNPDKTENMPYIEVVTLSGNSIATSGNYERYFNDGDERINHIFDARTGLSSNNYKSVSVIAEDALTADALATVYYLSGVDEIEYMCVNDNVSVIVYTIDNNLLRLCW